MVAAIILLLANPLQAQPLFAVARFKTILTEQFKNLHVSSRCIATDGTLFIGTNDGLFKTEHEQLHKVLLPPHVNTIINSLLYHDGLVYMGTNAGIFTYDDRKKSAVLVDITGRMKDTIRNYCQLMRIDRQQRLFFYTGYDTSAYYFWDIQRRRSAFLLHKSDGFRDFDVDQQDALTKVWAVEPVGMVAYKLDGNALSGKKMFFYGGVTGPAISVAGMTHDQHSLWCATNKGLLQLNLRTEQWRWIKAAIPSDFTDVVQYRHLIICASTNGLHIYDTLTHQWQLPIVHIPDDSWSLPGNEVHKIGLIRKDILLVATNKGISFLLLDTANQFVYALPGSNHGDQLSWIHNGVDGIASCNQHLYLLDQFGGVKRTIQLQQSIPIRQALSLGADRWLMIAGNRCFYVDGNRCIEMKSTNKVAVSKFEFITAGRSGNFFIAGSADGLYLMNINTASYQSLAIPPAILFPYYQYGIATKSLLAANANYSYFDLFSVNEAGTLLQMGRIPTGCNINDALQLAKDQYLLACNNGLKIADWQQQQLRSIVPDFDENVRQLIAKGNDTMLITASGLYRFRGGQVAAVSHSLDRLFNNREAQPVSMVNEQLMWSHAGLIYRLPLNFATSGYTDYLSANVQLNGTNAGDMEIALGNSVVVDVDVVNYHPFVASTLYYNVSNDSVWLPVPKEAFSIDRLPAGKFIIAIKAKAGGVTWYQSAYTVTVVPAWHQTTRFKLLMYGLLLLGICALFAWIILVQRRKANEKLRLQKLISSLETKALRSQMNPHFVFNTMNSINSAVIENDTEKASECILQFSKLMRQTLDNSQHEFVTLDKELAALAIYLQLEQFRLDHAFQCKISIDDTVSTSDWLIPPLVLQPYVENAIWHGLVHQQPAGLIDITVTAASEYYQIRIADNGIGRAVAGSLQQRTADRKSHGTAITEQRLKLMNPRNSVEMKDLAHQSGTVVLLTLFQPNT